LVEVIVVEDEVTGFIRESDGVELPFPITRWIEDVLTGGGLYRGAVVGGRGRNRPQKITRQVPCKQRWNSQRVTDGASPPGSSY
jgi:hypothetical protein